MNRLFRLTSLTLLLASATSLAAQERATAEGSAKELTTKSLIGSDFSDPTERNEFIATLNAYCHDLKAAYPRNSPSEDEWVRGELRSGDSNRGMRALGSAEFGRLEASRFVEACTAWSNSYLSNLNSRRELRSIALFALIRALIRYAPDAEHFAEMNGLDPAKWAFFALDDAAGALADIGTYEMAGFYEQ